MKFIYLGVCLILFSTAAIAQDTTKSERPQITAPPVALDWRSIKWPERSYETRTLPGGGQLYLIPSQAEKRFKVDIVFPNVVYHFPRSKRPTIGAAVDLLLQGGAGKRSYEQIDTYLRDAGISISTKLSGLGDLEVNASGLTQDFARALPIIEDVLMAPRFDKAGFDLWKQERVDEFNSLLDASTYRKQMRFIEQESFKLGFGPNHYFASFIERTSPKELNKITLKDSKAIVSEVISKTGIRIFVAGKYAAQDLKKLEQIVSRLPRKIPRQTKWLPERPLESKNDKLRVQIIQKPDMSQASISYRVNFPQFGEFNTLEKTQFYVLNEVYSSSVGVVGSSRFSKALRGDSGISYSPSAFMVPDAISPNTNVGQWRMEYQSPNERIAESVSLAQKTWNDFVTQGITKSELANSRIALMNAMLSEEKTIFNVSEQIQRSIGKDEVPSALPTEEALVKLESLEDLSAINQLAQSLSHSPNKTMVIMGNVSDKEISLIKKVAGVEVVKILDFSSVIKSLK